MIWTSKLGVVSFNVERGEAVELEEIEFGYADAYTEAIEDKRLLLEAFYDSTIADNIWNGKHFLVLGLKGAGKSAIACRLQLEADDDPLKFVQILEMGQLSFQSFSKIRIDSAEDKSRYPATWKYMLYVHLLQQIMEDQSVSYADFPDFDRFVKSLREYGVLPADGLEKMVAKTKGKKFQINLLNMVKYEYRREGDSAFVDLSDLIELLENKLRNLSSNSEYRLIIDGLDDLLTDKQKQFEIIAALVHAVKYINEKLRETALNAKVILLVRSDIYGVLPDSNLNKFQRDFGRKIEWYDEASSMSESRLLKLINLRAELSCGESVNVVHRWLPRAISGNYGVEKYLLELTRHRPRDIIQLFNELKQQSTGGRLSEQQVLSAEKRYSRDYLLLEMQDEVRGLLSDELSRVAFDAVFSIRKAEFSLEEAYRAGEEFNLKPEDVIQILRQLFDCGTIGMKDLSGVGGHTTFKYRNPGAVFSTRGVQYILHRGIRQAANIASV